MGGSVSVFGRSLVRCHSSHAPDADDDLELNAREKQLVRSTWPTLQGRGDTLPLEVFLMIFELKPETKRFFPFKNAVGEALLKHPYFRGHATRFINAVQMTVVSLDAWNLILIPNLIKLGQQHATIPNFKHEYFDCFYQAMDILWTRFLGKAYNHETRHAWRKIFRLITSKVEEGYAEGEEIVRRNSRMSTAPSTDTLLKCPMPSLPETTGNGNSSLQVSPPLTNHVTAPQEAVHISETTQGNGCVSGNDCRQNSVGGNSV